jgi:hypothetical protein
MQRVIAAWIASLSVSPLQSSPATSSVKWRLSRKSRTPLGDASVVSAMRREAISQALAGSAARSFSMRAIVPQ